MVFGSPSGSTNTAAFFVTLTSGGDASLGSAGFIAPTIPHVNITAFDQPVLFYIDAGQAPTVFLDSFFSTFGPTTEITLIGDLINCSVSACAPIAH